MIEKFLKWLFSDKKPKKKKNYSQKGHNYEKKLVRYFQKQGYRNVQQTTRWRKYPNGKWYPQSDFGADIIMKDKKDRLIVVQAKWRKSSRVGPKAVSETAGAKMHYKAYRAILVTNSTFSNDAKRLAQSLKVELLDNIK